MRGERDGYGLRLDADQVHGHTLRPFLLLRLPARPGAQLPPDVGQREAVHFPGVEVAEARPGHRGGVERGSEREKGVRIGAVAVGFIFMPRRARLPSRARGGRRVRDDPPGHAAGGGGSRPALTAGAAPGRPPRGAGST